MRASRSQRHVADRPGRQHDGTGPRIQHIDDLLDVTNRPAPRRAAASFCTPVIPQYCTLRRRSARWRMNHGHVRPQGRHRGEDLTGERARDLGNAGMGAGGTGFCRTGFCSTGQAGRVPAQHRERQPGRARHVAVGHPSVLCSSSSSGPGQECSTASRNRCSDPTPGLPPQENTSLRAHPAPIIWS